MAGVSAGAAFLVVDPYSVLDVHNFWHGLTYDMNHYATGHPGNEGNTISTNLRWLWNAVGPALLLLPVAVWWIRDRTTRRLALVPLSFVVTLGVLMSAQRVRFERNLVPILPALLVIVAIVVAQMASQLARHISIAPVASWAIVLTPVLLWGAVFAVQDAAFASSDQRAAARTWIARNLHRGSTVVYDVYSPYVDPKRFHLVGDGFVLLLPNLTTIDADAVIVNGSGSGRFLSGASQLAAAKRSYAWLQRNACHHEPFNHGSTRIDVFRLRC